VSGVTLGRQAFLDSLPGPAFHPADFPPWLPGDQLDSYIAGLILLDAAPYTAMVFVWSRLTGGHPVFTLSQPALHRERPDSLQ
jgi:ACR3 family arsenite transporter